MTLVHVGLCDTLTYIIQGYFTGTGAIICPSASEVILSDMGNISDRDSLLGWKDAGGRHFEKVM